MLTNLANSFTERLIGKYAPKPLLTIPPHFKCAVKYIWHLFHSIFGRPFVKRFALCYQSVVCPVLSVTFVHCGQTVGLIKTKLGTQVGLGPGHIVLGGDPAIPPLKGHSPQFSAHICCGQMAAWIKISLGMAVGLGPGDFVLDGEPAPPPQKGGGRAPKFSAMFIVAKRLYG